MFWIIRIVLLTQVASIHSVFHQGVVNEGFCHLQEVELDWNVGCGSHFDASVTFSLVSRENEGNETELLSCRGPSIRTLKCAGSKLMSATYDTSIDALKIKFTFNNSIFGGQLLRSKTLCNGNPRTEHVLLKACLSGFSEHSVLYNDTNIIIDCQHSSFNYSSSPMRIKLMGKDEEYAYCYPNFCNDIRCKILPNGVQCTLPYTYGNMYQCVLDGSFYNISEPTIRGTTLMAQGSSTSESTIVSPDEMSPSQENTKSTTALPQMNPISGGPGENTSGIRRSSLKANTFLIIAALFLFHIYYYVAS